MKQKLLAMLLALGVAPCPAAMAQLTGTVMAPETKEQFILRSRYHIPGRTAATVVYLHSIASRDIREEYSSIATRNDDGSWTVGTMGEIGPATKAIKLRVIQEKLRKLSKADAAALDALLGDEALYLTASTLPAEPDNNATYRTMEIVTPGHRVVVRWIDSLDGKAGRVADLIAAGGAGAKRRARP